MLEIDVGEDIYCPREGWSGVVTDILCDQHGEPAVAIVENHDPSPEARWLCVPLDAYAQDETGHLHS